MELFSFSLSLSVSISGVDSRDVSDMVIEKRTVIIVLAFVLCFILLVHISSKYHHVRALPIACHRLIRPNHDESLRQICRYQQTYENTTSLTSGTTMPRSDNVTPIDYVSCVASLSNCCRFRSELGYIKHVTKFELEFPIAFSLLTYENFEQTERLLRLIYRPHNFYCLHVDAKSPPDMHSAAEAVASCLPNVIVARPAITVEWGRISVVEAELSCMKILLERDQDWKYFINLVGRDFPLKTNRELVGILRAYNGSNDVDGSRRRQVLLLLLVVFFYYN
jgi:Core-2/I-Branching enzyme